MKKFLILVFLVFSMLFCCACGINDPLGSDYQKPAQLTFNDEVYKVLELPSVLEDGSSGSRDVKYNLIMDSRITSSNNSSGYLKKNCYTFSQILACLKTSIAGEEYDGYYTGEDVEQQFNADTQANTSVIVSNYIRTDDFFANAVGARFPNTDMLPSEAIEQIAEDADRDSLYIFITDMAMPQASESYKIIEALGKIFSDNDLTVGLIGIKADYAGSVCNIPISHIGVKLSENKSYQKPIYLLYAGEKNAVFEAMDSFLLASKGNNSLNTPDQVQALYYYKYDCEPNSEAQVAGEQQPTISISYSGGLTSYMKQCTPECVFQIPDETDEKTLVDGVSLSKIYSGVLQDESISNDENNIEFSFTIPFQIASNTGTAESELLKAGGSIALSELDLSLRAEVQRVELNMQGDSEQTKKQGETLQMSNPESVDSKEINLYTDDAKFDLDNATVSVVGNYNVSFLELDIPVIYLARMTVECALPNEVLADAYDVSWLNDWQMDQTQLQKDWGKDTAIEQALRTPFIADIFGKALLDANITFVQRYISNSTTQYVQGIDFGLVLREQRRYYDSNWEDTDNQEGADWAFSNAEIVEMMNGLATSPSPES